MVCAEITKNKRLLSWSICETMCDSELDEQKELENLYHLSTNSRIFETSKYINDFETSYDKQFQAFLALSCNDIPNIVVSKSTPNSPSSICKVRSRDAETDVNVDLVRKSHVGRRLSYGSYVDNNSNRVQPKIQRLNSGENRSTFWRMNRQASSCSISSICSVDTNCMSDVSDQDDESICPIFSNEEECTPTKKESMWVKLRKAVRWSPFMQNYKKQYPWIQLAGHTGGFKPGEQGTILKKSCKNEVESLKLLMNDVLRPYIPEFKMVIIEDGHSYIQMQDLLAEFDQPIYVMDCKMGTRTYLEDEVNKVGKPRQDLYIKMKSVDPSEPTDIENETLSCTKPRYMQWREQLSSTATLGFRIEGVKRGDNNPDKDFKKIKSEEDVMAVFQRFISNKQSIQEKYLERLKAIKNTLLSSNFFQTHEIVGSSLLFIHDESGKASIWIIDFGKTLPVQNGTVIDHVTDWALGNHEDGYLTGLNSMINIWSSIECKNT